MPTAHNFPLGSKGLRGGGNLTPRERKWHGERGRLATLPSTVASRKSEKREDAMSSYRVHSRGSWEIRSRGSLSAFSLERTSVLVERIGARLQRKLYGIKSSC